MVDVEADGPIPGDYSMISFGAVVVKDGLDQTFYRIRAAVLQPEPIGLASVTGLELSTSFSALAKNPFAGVVLLSGVGAKPPPDGV